MKTLNDLKNNKSKHGDTFCHIGRSIMFHGETPTISAHYKLYPLNFYGTVKTKKEAIKHLESNN